MEVYDHDKLETVNEWNALVSSNKNFITKFSSVFFLSFAYSRQPYMKPSEQAGPLCRNIFLFL